MEDKFYSKFTEGKKSKKVKRAEANKKIQVQPESNQKKFSYNNKTSQPNHKNSNSSFLLPASALFSTSTLDKFAQTTLSNFDEIIQGVRPLNSRQIQQLPDNIRSLSHQLTDQRSERRLGYMNDNIQLSSYVRYFTWWNLVRLTRLFSNLPESSFPQKEDSICLDLGSGPLTVVTALWLARPELRNKKFTWYCLDVSSNSMALGEDIYLSIAARTPDTEPWKIIRVKGSFGTSIRQKCDFITCANMFNELDQASDMPPEFQSKKYFDQLKNYAAAYAHFLLIEPGVPKAARTLSLLRDRFLRNQDTIIAPCPHSEECPMNGFKSYTGSKNKWCNFAFNTEDAPVRLQKLSTLAKLPKERAVLSFISASSHPVDENNKKSDELLLRIASDSFMLPNHCTGYYACSKLGLTLVKTSGQKAEKIKSGDLIPVKIKTPDSQLKTDEKSGALIIEI